MKTRTILKLAMAALIALSLIGLQIPTQVFAGNEIQLTKTGNFNAYPAWSPDGKKIAYQKWVGSDGNIWIINADGSNEQKSTTVHAWAPSFRQGKDQIYFIDDSDGGLWWVAWTSYDGSAGRNPLILVPGGDTFTPPSFSEDGSRLCYLHKSYDENWVRGVRREIKIANADGTGINIILRDDSISNADTVIWGKGSSANKIAYVKPVSDVKCLFTIDSDGKNVTQITDPSMGDFTITDFVGDKVFFSNKNQLFYINIQTKKITQITNDAYENSQAVLSPDGKKIAYVSKRNGVGNIYITGDPDSEPVTPGTFTVDDTGIVKIDWLYDGGRYQGEFGIFNIAGMENLTPGSPEFIAEAVKRVMSNSDQGYLVFSDLSEGARFSGILGNEIKDWNAGPYNGLKSFAMAPGTQFATILVPNSTFASLAQDPATADTNKRPLFSLVSQNPAYGMYLGQMADINGMGKAYSYEDKDAETSDWDFNDIIVQITGAESNLPSLDSLVGTDETATTARSKRDKRDRSFTDWRTNTELGQMIMAHIEAPAPTSDSTSMTITLNTPATLLVYDPKDNVIGKDGGTIPGATFEVKADGTQTVTFPNLNPGSYRVSVQGSAAAQGVLTVKTSKGGAELSSNPIALNIAPHQILTTTISADTQPPSVAPLNAAASYDFNADGIVDNTDVEMLVKHWNSCRGQQKYDPFFDVNDDGCITVADIMTVLNAKTVK